MPVYNKLVRDKMPEIIIGHGDRPVTKKLDNQEFKLALLNKLVEEAEEVKETKDLKELKKELADVFEVLDSVMKMNDIHFEEIKIIQKTKKDKKGGFDDKVFLIETN